jgi:hypothetical protein
VRDIDVSVQSFLSTKMRVSSAPSYPTTEHVAVHNLRPASSNVHFHTSYSDLQHYEFPPSRYSPITHHPPDGLIRAAAMPYISRSLYHYCAPCTTDAIHFPYRESLNCVWHRHGSRSIAVPQLAAIVATAPIQTLLALVCVHSSYFRPT